MNNKKNLSERFQKLFDESGTHSPSLFTIKEEIPELSISIDACFLSNPYATDLFMEKLKQDILDTGLLREKLEFYPSQNRNVSKNLSKALNVNKDNIFIGNGATEIIQAVFHNFVRDTVVLNIPTFSPYYEFVKNDTKVIYNKLLKEEDFYLDADKFCDKVLETNADTAVLINPNNPDGGYLEKEKILKIAEKLKNIENLIIDESFIHFAYESDDYDLKSSVELTKQYENLIVVKSMSKDFGVAGIRAGYAIMSKERVNTLLRNGYLWNINGITEYFFDLYSQKEFMNEYNDVRVKYIKETDHFYRALKSIRQLRVYPSKANFFLVELPAGIQSQDFVKHMLIDEGIYFRSCDDKLGLDGSYIRIASRDREQNKIIIEKIKKYFGE